MLYGQTHCTVRIINTRYKLNIFLMRMMMSILNDYKHMKRYKDNGKVNVPYPSN